MHTANQFQRRSLTRVSIAVGVFVLLATSCSQRRSPWPEVADSPLTPPPHDVDMRALARRELAVGFVVVDGVYGSELVAPHDVFQHTIFHVDPGMRVFLVGPSREPITSFEGLRLIPDYTFDDAPPIDVLVVPSAEHNMDTDLEDERLIGFVRAAGRRASFCVSLCDGAFVLAQAGLLDGRRATTFPSDVARMREMFRPVRVLENLSFVHDGPMITSAGGALSYDAALYLCELLYGERAAQGVAGGICIDWDLKAVDHLPDLE